MREISVGILGNKPEIEAIGTKERFFSTIRLEGPMFDEQTTSNCPLPLPDLPKVLEKVKSDLDTIV